MFLLKFTVRSCNANAIFAAVFGSQAALAGNPFDSKYPNIVVPQTQFGEFGRSLGQFNEPSDVAVSENGEVYIVECYNRRIQVVDRSGAAKRAWTSPEAAPLKCPQAIAVDRDGVFVADTGGHITVFTDDGQFVRQFGQLGSAAGQLRNPQGVALYGDTVAVANSGNNRIDLFKKTGDFLTEVNIPASKAMPLMDPRSVAFDVSGHMYVGDLFHRIVKFSPTGAFLKSWGTYGSFSGEFAEPNHLSMAKGLLYVADLTNHRLQVFDTNGDYVMQWGRHPETEHQGLGHTHYPTSIAADPNGEFVVVCEQFEYRCQVFDIPKIQNLAQSDVNAWWTKFPQFHYGGGARIVRRSQMSSTVGATLDADKVFDLMIMTKPDMHKAVVFGIPNSDTLDANSLTVVGSVGGVGAGPGKFAMPSAKAASAVTGKMFIGDAGFNNIQVFDLSTLDYDKTLFGPGTGPGQFNGPSFLLVGSDQRYYVGDFHNDRIQMFDANFNFLKQFGGTGDGPGKLFGPLSGEFSPDHSKIYVSDTGNQRIVIYDREGNFVSSFGRLTRPGEWGNGTFQWPFDVAVAPDGSVYVTDPSLQLVQKFDADGKFIRQWGGWGTKPGQFYKCKGIDVDSRGRVYVIDFGNHRGQIFDPDGNFLAIFGEGVLYPAISLGPDGKPKQQ
ncbi:NHL repeat-containing protein [Rhodopseudomonas palustris]|uniref:NHL repeat-containing protein n=1 Tax=Rhodopseudomonas palustris TaxID=1076 RepID=UPI000D19900A|nr:NHL repeat-containing protein [Rhodopseudomonas palustris]AVT81427.1 hypothetical protein RPYSC3_25660 [Rhodopseudomonas palustris]